MTRILFILATLSLSGFSCKSATPHASRDVSRELIFGVTTSTYDTGVAEMLSDGFMARSQFRVKVIAAGTGETLELGRRGSVDIMLVHAPEAEKEFMEKGHGVDRQFLMWNDFLIVGPVEDPAEIRGLDPADAMKKMAQVGARFISRGDRSGTHQRELAIRSKAGVMTSWSNYQESGQGMAATLRVADEMRAYSLTDRGTFEVIRKTMNLVKLVEKDRTLVNLYHMIRVNPRAGKRVNVTGGKAMMDYVTSEATRGLIEKYGVSSYGAPLFFVSSPPS